VSGKVLLEGTPAAGARVVFHPLDEDANKAVLPQAQVAADGSFRVSTYNFEDGAPAGSYKVAITHIQEGGPNNLMPERYADPETSGFEVTVENRNNEFDSFSLSR
jgi:hypothetical protein